MGTGPGRCGWLQVWVLGCGCWAGGSPGGGSRASCCRGGCAKAGAAPASSALAACERSGAGGCSNGWVCLGKGRAMQRVAGQDPALLAPCPRPAEPLLGDAVLGPRAPFPGLLSTGFGLGVSLRGALLYTCAPQGEAQPHLPMCDGGCIPPARLFPTDGTAEPGLWCQLRGALPAQGAARGVHTGSSKVGGDGETPFHSLTPPAVPFPRAPCLVLAWGDGSGLV